MSRYQRFFVPGGTYFFTVVAYHRRPILTTACGRQFLREAIRTVRTTHPFELFATVLLADHWHLVMELPPEDADYSLRLRKIKSEFTGSWLAAGLPEAVVTPSQRKRGERGIWQPRFWEHTVRDEEDLERCVDYIHWNPRKHQCVNRISDYQWSTFHRLVAEGQYEIGWGGTLPTSLKDTEEDWGEP
ncbi:REP-associated tyrosine transposase [Novipirellula rosea]|uniref:Transposase n=1 Tax=Novipirellula rosea TaxID=1031540 RepID=A0ABP8N8R7_9BACT